MVVSEVTPDAGCAGYTVTVTPESICGGGNTDADANSVADLHSRRHTRAMDWRPARIRRTIVRYGFAQTATDFYVFGGVDNGFTTNAVNRYNLATGTWTPRAPMPFSGEAPTCALMESTGIVYCADGYATNSFAAYDIAS